MSAAQNSALRDSGVRLLRPPDRGAMAARMSETPPFQPLDGPANEPTEADLHTLLQRLRHEHRAIDHEIKALAENGVMDVLKIRRMKKIKLAMKDRIAFIENQLTPDIIA